MTYNTHTYTISSTFCDRYGEWCDSLVNVRFEGWHLKRQWNKSKDWCSVMSNWWINIYFAILLTFRWVVRDISSLEPQYENSFFLAQVRRIFWYFSRFSQSHFLFGGLDQKFLFWYPLYRHYFFWILFKKDTRDAWICKKFNFI
jgi:hypothetical protein